MYVYNLLVEVRDGNIVSEDETPILRHARLRYLVYVCGGWGRERGAGEEKDRQSEIKKVCSTANKKMKMKMKKDRESASPTPHGTANE